MLYSDQIQLDPVASDPVNPTEGQIWYNSTEKKVKNKKDTSTPIALASIDDVSNRDPKESVRIATTENITLSGLQTIDGKVLVAGDRVLVKNQNTASQNGIYSVASGSWARTTDADDSIKVNCGCEVYVEEGTINATTHWVLITPNPITLGSTSIAFECAYEAGTGLTRTKKSLAVNYGTTNDTACIGNDARLSDDRTGAGLRSATTVVSVSGATAPSSGQVLTATANNNATWQTPSASGAVSVSQVTNTNTHTSSSGTYALLDSQTATPGAGNYMVWFSTNVSHSASNGIVYISIFSNGVQIAESERKLVLTDQKQQGQVVPLETHTYISGLGAGQAIEVKWKTSGATASCYNKTLMIAKV
jgi:phage-related tail fiber protein